MAYEGAILGGYLLPENEFIQLMTELLNERGEEIIHTYIIKIIGYVYTKEIRLAYKEWQLLQKDIFHNKSTELLALINYQNSGLHTEWVFTDEENVLQRAGGLSLGLIQQIEKEFKNAQKFNYINKHLNQMINTIRDERMTYKKNGEYNDGEQNYISSLKRTGYRSRLLDIWNKKENKKPSYLWIIYGATSTKTVNARGKMADAFLNHLGKIHKSFFSTTNTGYTFLNESQFSQSVKEEENSAQRLGFLHLLLDSMNTTEWYRGGDLVTVDKTGYVDFSIQLKTSAKDEGSVGAVSYKKFGDWLTQVLSKFEDKESNEQVAKIFYENLKISTVSEALGDEVIKTAYDLAKKSLQLSNK